MSRLSKLRQRSLRRRNRSKPQSSVHPRLVVHRSLRNIGAQIINDLDGVTVASASTLDKSLQKDFRKAKSKVEKSKIVGAAIAEKAKKAKVKTVVFDRNGNPYHGRVKAFAEAAREAGLKF